MVKGGCWRVVVKAAGDTIGRLESGWGSTEALEAERTLSPQGRGVASHSTSTGLLSGTVRVALDGKGPQRRPQRRQDRRLEEVSQAVGGGYCRLQMPWKLALGVRETVAGQRLGALEGGGGVSPPPLPMHPWARPQALALPSISLLVIPCQ